MSVLLCLYMLNHFRDQRTVQSWIIVGSVLCLCTPGSLSVPEMYTGGGILFEHVPLMEFMYLVFTCMPGESFCRRLRSLLLYLCYIFWALIGIMMKYLHCTGMFFGLVCSVNKEGTMSLWTSVSTVMISNTAIMIELVWPNPFLRWSLCTLYLLACQVTVMQVTLVFVIIVFVWRLSGAR